MGSRYCTASPVRYKSGMKGERQDLGADGDALVTGPTGTNVADMVTGLKLTDDYLANRADDL